MLKELYETLDYFPLQAPQKLSTVCLKRGCDVLSSLPAPLTTRSPASPMMAGTHSYSVKVGCVKVGCALQAQEKAAQQQLPNVRFETGDMDALGLPAGAFDAALCSTA